MTQATHLAGPHADTAYVAVLLVSKTTKLNDRQTQWRKCRWTDGLCKVP